MEKFDAIFLGAGPTAPTIFEHYKKKKAGRTGKYLLVSEKSSPEGAITKGAKTVNQIVPKLPHIREDNLQHYKETFQMIESSEIQLQLLFGRTTAYLGSSEIGYRYCRTHEEFSLLESIQNIKEVDRRLAGESVQFLQSNLGYEIDESMLFPYRERVWNINAYLDILNTKIENNVSWAVETVKYDCYSDGGVTLEIKHLDGTFEKVWTERLIICKGLGNVDFERDVKLKESSLIDKLNFQILKYYKCICRPKLILPQTLSSIFLAQKGLCVTNELDNCHSILYNTNSGTCHVNQFAPAELSNELIEKRNELHRTYPLLPNQHEKEFMCVMAVDSLAYTEDPTLHFKFILSQSLISNIHYVNLPYFSVIGSAKNYLPETLNKF